MNGEIAGALRERVAVLGAAPRDAAGAATGDPVVGAAVWASVQALRTASGVDAERMASPARYRIIVRDVGGGPKTGQRLRWRGTSLAVLSVTRDPLSPGVLELIAEAR